MLNPNPMTLARCLPILLAAVPAVLAGCGGDTETPAPVPAARAKPEKKDAQVLKWEAEGRKKCEMGLKLVHQRLDSGATADPDIVRFDLEAAYVQLDEGLAAYASAAKKSGRSYDVDAYRKARERAMTTLCDTIEREARASCESGLGMIRKCESLMSGRALNDEERHTLRRDLTKGKALIEKGMGLFERSNELTGHTFDTTRYGQAMKAASMKLLELKE